jgi:hypothetical protein
VHSNRCSSSRCDDRTKPHVLRRWLCFERFILRIDHISRKRSSSREAPPERRPRSSAHLTYSGIRVLPCQWPRRGDHSQPARSLQSQASARPPRSGGGHTSRRALPKPNCQRARLTLFHHKHAPDPPGYRGFFAKRFNVTGSSLTIPLTGTASTQWHYPASGSLTREKCRKDRGVRGRDLLPNVIVEFGPFPRAERSVVELEALGF